MNETGSSTPSDTLTFVLPIVLTIQGLGHVPSFKNKKRSILDRNTGKQRTLTEAKTKRWMDRCIASFVSQLLCATQTIAGGTTPGRSKLSSIVLSLPLDDCRKWIPEIHITTVDVDRGNEGAVIYINQITSQAP